MSSETKMSFLEKQPLLSKAAQSIPQATHPSSNQNWRKPSPRWLKVIRDLWSNKTRTLIVVLSIAVGVFSVGMIIGSQMILADALPSSYAATHPAHAILYGNFDDEAIIATERIAGVQAAEGRGRVTVQLQVAPDEWRELSLKAIPDYDQIAISQFSHVDGTWAPDEREFLIEQGSLPESGTQVGEKVVIEMEDGTRHQMRLSGVVHDLAEPSALFESTLKAYINRDTQEWLQGRRNFSELHLLVNGQVRTEQEIEPIADEVKNKLEKGGYDIRWTRIPPPSQHWADDILKPMMQLLAAMGAMSMVLSGFLVVNTINALLAQQTKQIAVMKTIGARTKQLIEMYLTSVVIFGLLSLLVAVPLGAWASHAFANFTASLLNFYHISFRIPPGALALEIGVGITIPIIAALWPVLSGTRLTIREGLSHYGLGKGEFGSHPIDRFLEKIKGLPRPLILSLRNTFRRKGRLLLTLSTLTLGGSIFIAVTSVHASLLQTLDEALAYWNYDINVDLVRPYRIDLLTKEALNVPGVVEAESWARGSARRIREDESESPDIRVLAPPANTQMLNPNLLAGRWLLDDDQNALVINSVVLDEDPDIQVGDQITLKIDGREAIWHVVGIVQGIMTGPNAYVNYPYFAQELRFVGRAGRLQVVTDQKDPNSQIQIATALSEHFESQGINVSSTDTIHERRSRITNQFNIIVTFLSIMAVLIAIVGALGLMGTMSINVLERRREIGVMRAIGASNGSVLQIFMVEGMLIGSLSWAVGGVIAIPVSQILCDVVGVSFLDAPLSYTFSIQGAILWLGIVLVLAAFSSWWPSWQATRVTVRDVLAYE